MVPYRNDILALSDTDGTTTYFGPIAPFTFDITVPGAVDVRPQLSASALVKEVSYDTTYEVLP